MGTILTLHFAIIDTRSDYLAKNNLYNLLGEVFLKAFSCSLGQQEYMYDNSLEFLISVGP